MKAKQTQLLLLLILMLSVSCSEKKSAIEIDPPAVEKAIFYHLNVRDFTSEGTFKAMIPRLAELKSLGVNTLVFAPIHPIGLKNRQGSLGSVYASSDFKGLHPELGSKADFKALVDSCHAQGLYVLLTWDGSITSADHSWLKTHPEWYQNDSAYYPVNTKNDLSCLNVNNPLLQQELYKSMRFWVKEAVIDGFYVHSANVFPLAWWANTIAELKKIKPLLFLAESANPKLAEAGFDLLTNAVFSELITRILDKNSRHPFIAHPDSFLSNPVSTAHFRAIHAMDSAGNVIMPLQLYGNRKAAMIGFLLNSLLPGKPFLIAGEEAGHAAPLQPYDKNTIIWSANPDIRSFYSTLLQLSTSELAFQSTTLQIDSLSHPNILLLRRGNGLNTLYCLINPTDSLATVSLPVELQGKRFIDRFSGRSVLLEKELFMLDYSFYLLKEESTS